MKRNILYRLSVLLAATVVAIFAIGCGDSGRQQILKVYNWGDYIDEDLIAEF